MDQNCFCRMLRAALFAMCICWTSSPAGAADQKGSGAACKDLDFLVGKWLVTSADGRRVAEITWEPSADHCFLKETWARPSGAPDFFGLMAYSAEVHDWSYVAVQANGVRERFDRGAWLGAELRFVRSEPPGKNAVRLGFTPISDGAVREVAELSADGGRSWMVRYDLKWTRLPGPR